MGVQFILVLAVLLLWVGLRWARSLRPDAKRLKRDLALARRLVPLEQFQDAAFTSRDVAHYYASTTFRDYRLLELATGCDAMHTVLKDTSGRLPYDAGHLKQLLYVLAFMDAAATSGTVLEVGSGKGTNSLYLASLFPHATFVGVDLTPAHVELSNGHG